MNHKELREEIVLTSSKMAKSNLVTGTSGNISARTPQGDVLITPSGVDYDAMQPEDVVLVSAEGQMLEGDLTPSSETPMHTGIYRSREEVQTIVHTHAPYSTILACMASDIPAVHYLVFELSEEEYIPLAPYTTPTTEKLAELVSDTLGDKHYACLLQNHGNLTVGKSLEEAYSRSERLEEMAMLYYHTKLAGGPVILTPEQAEQFRLEVTGYSSKS